MVFQNVFLMAATMVAGWSCFALDYRPLGACPDAVTAEGAGFTNALARADDVWTSGAIVVTTRMRTADSATVSVASPEKGLRFVRLFWKCALPADASFLGDTWERSYGNLGWRKRDASGPMPWYFLANDGAVTHGYGVGVQPNALACWRVRADGIELQLDLRAGGQPVRLGSRTLVACTVMSRKGVAGERAWAAGHAFCRMMCPFTRLPKEPVYGYNDWYCAYGRNTGTNFLADAAYIAECAKGLANRPYVVMDDGWQPFAPPVCKNDSGRGPWDRSGDPFGMEMSVFAKKVAALDAKPGLWYRPFRAWDNMPAEWRLRSNAAYVDPTVPDVKRQVYGDVSRFRTWGFKLVKIDYLTFDINNRWGFSLGDRVIHDDRAWTDDSRTTAEVLLDLYRTMRAAAGDDMVIIGCNALNHFAAGLFELQRTGDDTSGREWARTRRMGPNTLGFRSIQDRVFFAVDADCVGMESAGAVPWEKNRQWLDLVARSGTPLFVSWHRKLATPEFRAALSEAFRHAAGEQPTGEPLDWMSTQSPAKWRFGSDTVEYNWD